MRCIDDGTVDGGPFIARCAEGGPDHEQFPFHLSIGTTADRAEADRAVVICDADETARLLDPARLVEALARALVEHEDGTIVCPPRLVVDLSDDGLMLSMPAVAADLSIHKLITVVPANARRAIATIQGLVTVIDTATGTPSMLLDGPVVTGRRTAALSMLALRHLADPGAADVLLIGTGTQARHHVEALARLRPDLRVHVRATSREAAERFALRHRDAIEIVPAVDGRRHDVVIACTTSPSPVYVDAARADCLVIATGSFQPAAAEIAAATVRASTVYVDDADGARHEAGDLILAGVAWDLVLPLATTMAPGWTRPPGPLLFKSVGCAAWDLAAARVAVGAAR